jgi:murein DD-endopeptidase MepM/ murein hydrolase activator NlpD
LTRRIIATGLAAAALYAAVLGTLATAQDPPPAATPAAAGSAAPVGTAAPTQTGTLTADPTPETSSTAAPSPIPSPVETTIASPEPTSSATATPGATPSATSTATASPSATATPGDPAGAATGAGAPGPSNPANSRAGGSGSAKACTPGERSSTSTSGRDCSTPVKQDAPAPVVPAAQLSNPDGSPSAWNPTYSLAVPGAAHIGVPNFFIDKFRIPPFLLPIYQAAGMQYGIRWEVLAAINEIETDYGRNLNISSAGAVGWMQFMPATWKMYGVDANRDGQKDPFNPVDAVFAAARYLRAAGGDSDLRRAIFAYNHAGWYVDSVLMRAQVIGGLPTDLVGSLTGLTQGRFPVAAKATYAGALRNQGRRVKSGNAAMVVESDGTRKGIDIFSKDKAPVIAVNDGKVTKLGATKKLGTFVQVQDVYGNTYTYSHLGSVAKTYPAPKPRTVRKAQIRAELALPNVDAKPKGPASRTAKRSAKRNVEAAAKGAMPAAPTVVPSKADKQRLFANPNRPNARVAGGAAQLGQAAAPTTTSTSAPIGFNPKDFTPKPLERGARLIGGTVIGHLGKRGKTRKARLHFEIRPAGQGAPRIDPKPILDGWKLLESTAIYRAAGRNPFFGADAETPSIGQILLMSKETLVQRVLADRRIDIYGCGRHDIATGQIDRRVLATLEYLASSGLKPTISALKCGHGLMTASGNVSEHSTGTAVDIAAINGIVITPSTQGPGSITDLTIQRLLTLQGTMKPHQIISLMTFKDADNTLAMADHDDHIHVGWQPLYGQNRKVAKQIDAILKPQQWIKLIDRLGSIDNPVVRAAPSRYSVKVTKPAAKAGAGD